MAVESEKFQRDSVQQDVASLGFHYSEPKTHHDTVKDKTAAFTCPE